MKREDYERISLEMNDPILEWRKCHQSGEEFAIFAGDVKLLASLAPAINGKKEALPLPTLSPESRARRRLAWKNETHLYRRKCNATNKDIISVYTPTSEYKVYHQDIWFGDSWDRNILKKEIDYMRPFFAQFDELIHAIPHPALLNKGGENSDYCNNTVYEKNSYLTFLSGFSESCAYTFFGGLNKDSLESYNLWRSQKCHGCIWTKDSFECFNCIDTYDSTKCHFLIDSRGCADCAYSLGIRNMKYVFKNEQKTKDEYQGLIQKMRTDLGFQTEIEEAYKKMLESYKPINYRATDSLGTLLTNTQDIFAGWSLDDCRNMRYTIHGFGAQDSMDLTNGGALPEDGAAQKMYEACDMYKSSLLYFTTTIWEDCHDVYYSSHCLGSHHLFGCFGVLSGSYMIFNKPYTKEEWDKEVSKLIAHMRTTGEWGEFFPSSIALHGYNTTLAQAYFPLTREEASTLGMKWEEYESPIPEVMKIIPADKLPKNVEDIPDDILSWAIECEVSKKPFKIIKQELEFYRKYKLPIPTKHPEVRLQALIDKRKPSIFPM